MARPRRRERPEYLLSVRASVILVLGLLTAGAAGALTSLAGRGWAEAGLAAGAAFVAAVYFFDQFVEKHEQP
ncbi:hypothetical protein [Phytohabitans rumicis]|uniref:Uncharacterized protein n=1 Tax=Phytohabitans rumicis TaxID=1076125 RepID=A0A6V8LKI3_9ACTN|nr:hypothetical protein [Phytohabitans rumicis]GFJ93145.1 hypothetical protein Prum_067870 [Phytohabitans rumicis]